MGWRYVALEVPCQLRRNTPYDFCHRCGLVLQALSGGGRFFDQGSVLLCDLVELHHGFTDLVNAARHRRALMTPDLTQEIAAALRLQNSNLMAMKALLMAMIGTHPQPKALLSSYLQMVDAAADSLDADRIQLYRDEAQYWVRAISAHAR